ncbi:TetR/AcrR family transcriptional regulator [Streptomyces mangrovisoli]|uniref:HTH tetR-type domain-containing protein n=1 Tax=Streptomyces mangrovisoli TaxID=1428628 RepID=A0A1J4NUY2_9ACTN|nr:TetR/AcrR family transcriptional regulator [Streptomyces mangrovisoli]OIJ64942.1 hypothetical protein WN71_025990 [Streptomyces mangrovisoli]
MSAAEHSDTPASRGRVGRPPSVEARQRTLKLAGELLDQHGYQRMTMDDLATGAGVSKKTVYRWWPHKAALVADVIADRSFVRSVPDSGDTREELLELFDAIQAYTRSRDVHLMTMLVDMAVADDGTLQRALSNTISLRRNAARLVLQRGIARGDLPVDLDCDTLLDLWNGLAAYRQSVRPAPLPDTTVAQLVDLALAGHTPRIGEAG